MSAQRFSTGKCFHWQGVSYEVRRLLPKGTLELAAVFTRETIVVELTVLIEALFAGKLWFVSAAQGVALETAPHAQSENHTLELADYPEHLVAIARRRLEVIRPLLELGTEKRTRAQVLARVQEVQVSLWREEPGGLPAAVSVASVYRWIKDYTESGGDLRALIPATRERGGRSSSRLNAEVEALIAATLQDKYHTRETTTIDDMLHEVLVRLEEENGRRPAPEKLTPPSRKTIARRINDLDVRERFAAKHGERAAKQAFTQYGQTPYPQQPLERVEIEHTRIDLIVIDDADSLPLGRLTLTYCLDMATRYPLGYYLGFEPPSYLTVMECLHHAICPKGNVRDIYGTEHEWIAYGIPTTLVVDNGKEFIGQDLQDACLLLGIVLQQTPVKTPHFKAGVERVFGTLNTMLFHTLPGTTYSNPQQRGDYDSFKQACVYLSEIDQIMNIFTVDIYAQRLHRGLEAIPAQRWEAALQAGFWPRVPPSAEELAILLGRVAHRAIQPYGLRFQSLRYNSPELTPLRTRLKGAPAKLKYHPADLSRLYVYDAGAERYIEVPALDQEYTRNLSLWKHRIIRRAAHEAYGAVDMVALGRAKRQIQEIVDAGKRRKQARTRSRAARWDTGGKSTREVTAEGPSETSGEPVFPTVSPAAVARLPENSDQNWPAYPVPEDLADEGWEITYDLPYLRRELNRILDQEGADDPVD